MKKKKRNFDLKNLTTKRKMIEIFHTQAFSWFFIKLKIFEMFFEWKKEPL
jgi:hypothetical protein